MMTTEIAMPNRVQVCADRLSFDIPVSWFLFICFFFLNVKGFALILVLKVSGYADARLGSRILGTLGE